MNAITEVDKGENLPTLFEHGLDTVRRPLWYNQDMLEGKCPKCGAYYAGWALRNPRHQTCLRCGIGLEITEDGHKVFQGYSPFGAEELSINRPKDVPPPDKEKGKRGQKK